MVRAGSTWPIVLLFALAWSVAPRRALAGNDEGILIGNQAVLTGGAVTAIVSDGTSAWYNPAGLALLERATFDVNGSTYGISYGTSKNLFTLPGGRRDSASVIDWQLIPTALSYARRLTPKLVGAFGVFVPHATDSDLRAAVSQPDGSRWVFGLDQLRNDYAYVLSVSVKTHQSFRWGVALHGVYISNEETQQLGIGRPDTPDSPFVLLSEHLLSEDYGARVGLGLQWTPVPRFSLGASLQTPTLTIFRSTADDRLSSINAEMSASFDAKREDSFKSVWEWSTPLALRVGFAYTVDRVQYLLDGTFYTAVESGRHALDRKLSGNARAGCLIKLSDKLTLGSGLFSDLNGRRGVGAHFVGAAAGLQFAESWHLLENGKPLTFTTTLGLRYAYGWGKTQGIRITDADVTQAELSLTSVRLRVHEAALNLGAGVSY